MYQETKIRELISNLWTEPNKHKSLDIAIELANELLLTFGAPSTSIKTIDEALEAAYEYSHFKNQKMETWFEKHRFYGDARTAFRLFDDTSEVYESSFYWMNESSTKGRIAATTLLGSNWEDSELTMKPEYKLGIDFYLNHDANALLLVVSKKGNVRVLEFSERFTHTQKEIIEDLINVFNMPGIDMDDAYEPQRSIHEKIWSTLQLNTVNKAFYKGISELFEELSLHLKTRYSSKDSKDLQLFSSRLLGRLLFVWFLRKKHIIDETHGYFDYETTSSTDYYNQKLKLLFFDTLNNQIADRSHNDNNTPFLNGGLFEAHENDFYNEKLEFPNNYFTRLYEHLNKYNFTVDESTPEYEQIAIDPEMLGRVFENLLASIVPETSSAANERKNKGAFYTPREIVSYMCKESLKEHIKTKLNDESKNDGVDMLIDMNDAKFIERKSTGGSKLWGERSVDTQKGIIQILNEVKIFDPACGSGAFPMGMLQLISQTYDRLVAKYDTNEKKHVYASGKSTYNKYESKLNIIKNNLFGSDIEPMAIEIARLRSWLSLIIEENNEVHPLPNLDFNFVCSNSLLKLEENTNLFGLDFEEEFKYIREEYFSTHSKKKKFDLKNNFKNLYTKSNDNMNSKRVEQLKTWNPFVNSTPSNFFDSKVMFDIDRFDIVIANPPYIQLQKNKGELANLYKDAKFKSFEKTGDIYVLFYELALDILKPKGLLSFITSNKWLRVVYGKKIRNLILTQFYPITLIDLGSGIFESATVDTNIILIKNEKYLKPTKVASVNKKYKTNFSFADLKFFNTTYKKNEVWSILSNLDQQIKNKLTNYGIPIEENSDLEINRGILTGLNEAFIIDEIKRQEIFSSENTNDFEELIVPLLGGRNIKRHKVDFKNEFLLNIHNGLKSKNISRVKIEKYPEIKKHLDEYYDKLIKRQDKGDTPYNLRNCAYLDKISQPKIIYGEIVQKPSFYYDSKGYYSVLASAYLITGNYLKYYVSILNSDLLFYFFKEYFSGGGLGDNGVRFKKEFLEKLPLPKVSFDDIQNIENIFDDFTKGNIKLSKLQYQVDKLIVKKFKLEGEEIEYLMNKIKSK